MSPTATIAVANLPLTLPSERLGIEPPSKRRSCGVSPSCSPYTGVTQPDLVLSLDARNWHQPTHIAVMGPTPGTTEDLGTPTMSTRMLSDSPPAVPSCFQTPQPGGPLQAMNGLCQAGGRDDASGAAVGPDVGPGKPIETADTPRKRGWGNLSRPSLGDPLGVVRTGLLQLEGNVPWDLVKSCFRGQRRGWLKLVNSSKTVADLASAIKTFRSVLRSRAATSVGPAWDASLAICTAGQGSPDQLLALWQEFKGGMACWSKDEGRKRSLARADLPLDALRAFQALERASFLGPHAICQVPLDEIVTSVESLQLLKAYLVQQRDSFLRSQAQAKDTPLSPKNPTDAADRNWGKARSEGSGAMSDP
eukprot:jgi/Botrbrau1/7682/Bobra.0159s0124.1